MTNIHNTNHPFTELLICGGSEFSLSCYKYNFNYDSWKEYIFSLSNAVCYAGYDSSEDWGLGIVFTAALHLNMQKKTIMLNLAK
jgi:hypothetical protein